jgi:hypothetical protein
MNIFPKPKEQTKNFKKTELKLKKNCQKTDPKNGQNLVENHTTYLGLVHSGGCAGRVRRAALSGV